MSIFNKIRNHSIVKSCIPMFLSLSNSMSCLMVSNAEDKSSSISCIGCPLDNVQCLVSYISRQNERVRWFQYYGVYGMHFVLCPATYF